MKIQNLVKINRVLRKVNQFLPWWLSVSVQSFEENKTVFVIQRYYNREGESWGEWHIGGKQEENHPYCDYDCTGRIFCSYAKNWLNGLISYGFYGIDC